MPARHRSKLQANSLYARMLDFFRQNPEEELTYDDAEAKFGAPRGSIVNAMSRAKQEGEPVESVHLIRRRRGPAA